MTTATQRDGRFGGIDGKSVAVSIGEGEWPLYHQWSVVTNADFGVAHRSSLGCVLIGVCRGASTECIAKREEFEPPPGDTIVRRDQWLLVQVEPRRGR